ncbi:D-galacturonate reductase-like [Coffea arabica]|uniref:D-galacturonate reductase-like n=1 Tax=Coffea arabica TaxID=13443 RepID=A0A6P6V941_COFAR|nr:D-galacturonate reductase-like [Coffea arabica]
MAKVPEVTLSSCEKTMPVIGMGTSSFPPADLETTKTAIIEAIKAGYRHFDTAFTYGSEKPLGEAIAEALTLGLIMSRDELFITTKLWSSSAERDQIVPACKMSLQNLQLDYIDLYLIHMPVRLTRTIRSTPVEKDAIEPLDVKGVWEGMEECVKLGLTKGIGVSNFSCKKLEEVLAVATIPPAVNQVELNPTWQQKGLREFYKAKGIEITAYSPLGANNTKWGDNRVMDSDVLAEIAKSRGKTVAQVALRWVYEQGVSLVTKSYNKERMKQNLQIFDWSLSEEELEKISQIPQRKAVTLASIFGPHDLVLELDAEF